MQIKKLFIALGIVLPLHMQGQNFLIKDAPKVIESYVNQFNREDNELSKQDKTIIFISHRMGTRYP